jgi:mRNA-degrading endonuclease RelE of RelBE toxin-antitoxin system
VTDRAWEIAVSSPARRDLKRLDRQVRQRIYAALKRAAVDPTAGQMRKLTGRFESRLRVGDWRVLVELDAEARVIHVNRILPRGRAYDR